MLVQGIFSLHHGAANVACRGQPRDVPVEVHSASGGLLGSGSTGAPSQHRPCASETTQASFAPHLLGCLTLPCCTGWRSTWTTPSAPKVFSATLPDAQISVLYEGGTSTPPMRTLRSDDFWFKKEDGELSSSAIYPAVAGSDPQQQSATRGSLTASPLVCRRQFSDADFDHRSRYRGERRRLHIWERHPRAVGVTVHHAARPSSASHASSPRDSRDERRLVRSTRCRGANRPGRASASTLQVVDFIARFASTLQTATPTSITTTENYNTVRNRLIKYTIPSACFSA